MDKSSSELDNCAFQIINLYSLILNLINPAVFSFHEHRADLDD